MTLIIIHVIARLAVLISSMSDSNPESANLFQNQA